MFDLREAKTVGDNYQDCLDHCTYGVGISAQIF